MPTASVTFSSELDHTTRKELDQLTAENTEYLLQEHDDDGHHTDITALSIRVSGDAAISGNATVNGPGLNSFAGPIKTTPYLQVDPIDPNTSAPTPVGAYSAAITTVTGSPDAGFGPGLRIRSQAAEIGRASCRDRVKISVAR